MKVLRIPEPDEEAIKARINRIYDRHHRAAREEAQSLVDELLELTNSRVGKWYIVPEPGDPPVDVPASLAGDIKRELDRLG